ncbi:phenoloxidase subunit 1-like [Trichoplusia ni]|uniref:tyrosinase n=1 Tax=Trichoplusia ni TaxID=7111 RepID=A0A7E5VPM8_TRINI|nr:phenoloxidase subunit 1-like [Trichoplusia ni]
MPVNRGSSPPQEMVDTRRNLLLFFERPTEPCFMKKGEDNAVFEIPEHYYPEKYKELANNPISMLSDRLGEEPARMIPVRNIEIPDLSLPMELPFNEQFSVFIPKHQLMATRLIDVFMGMKDLEDLQSICAYCQLRINPYMFNYCLSVAILHRPDTKGMDIPTFVETFPDMFMDPKVFRKAREISNVLGPGERMPLTIPVNFTASDEEPEQRVAYFREDIGVNLHHRHWHLVYPFDAGDIAIVDKDRRGELFYYMHQQVIARFDIERLCNDLPRVKRYFDFKEPVEEAYFPKLDSMVAGRTWPYRHAGTMLRDLDRPLELIKLEISDLERWRERFIHAVESSSVMLPNGVTIPLDEETGIDILGNIMESSAISVNRSYYGNFHNMGHVFISYSHDPDHHHLEPFSVMADSAVAMRDPTFYRWHSYIDDLFQLYKYNLPPYGDKLIFPGIQVSSLKVEGPAGDNTLSTFWELSTLDLARGMDFTPRGAVFARFTHLQHEEFTYVIEVNNTTDKSVMGTVRLFMAPRDDEEGNPLPFDEQRRHMIELDKFTAPLSPGKNTVRQRSVDSSVTIPYERTFGDQRERPGDPGTPESAGFDFCGCGWPHHLLIPKGTKEGYPVILFVMISNWDDDKVEQDLVGSCNDAASYCGIRDRKYPDRRAMGFPFDRAAPGTAALAHFLSHNMAVRELSIRFTDTTKLHAKTRR